MIEHTLIPTHPAQAMTGRNDIVVASVQYGPQPMLMERDVPVIARDGEVLYVNVFRPHGEGRFAVVISADIYGKDTINLDWLVGMHTRGEYDTSLYTAWESPDPGVWVPNGYAVVKAGLRGSSGSTGRLSPMSKVEAQDYYALVE